MKIVCKALDIVKKTTTITQKVFVYYKVSLDRKLWDKTMYVDDDVSLRDDSSVFYYVKELSNFFIIKIYSKIKKKANTYNRPYNRPY